MNRQWLVNRSLQEIRMLDEHAFAGDVLTLIGNLCRSYILDGIQSPSLASDVVNSMYAHMGYRLARVQFYMQNQGRNISPDGNDTEDALICNYLNTLENTVLVTNEDETIRVVAQTMRGFDEVFRRMRQEHIRIRAYYKHLADRIGGQLEHWLKAEQEYDNEGLNVHARCRAINCDEFLRQLRLPSVVES